MSDFKWWGDFTFDNLQTSSWAIGERSIIIQKNVNEWNSWNIETDVEIDQAIVHHDFSTGTVPTESMSTINMLGRYLENGSNGNVRVLPLLADRSVVARPATPLTLLAGEKTKLFVSTPIWFSAQTLPDNQRFLDLPFWRPSDSWFGASTIDGQLCYAKYTSAKVQLENIENRSHRAITPITVINNQDKPLVIERLNVPVNFLYLYYECLESLSGEKAGQFWTSEIVIKTDSHSKNVEMDIKDVAPTGMHQTDKAVSGKQTFELVSEPRILSEHNKLIRNISNLLG